MEYAEDRIHEQSQDKEQPEEIAPSYVFFASDADSNYITGGVLMVLGGETTAG